MFLHSIIWSLMVFKSRSEIGVETKQWLPAQLFSKFAQILIQVWQVKLKQSIGYPHSYSTNLLKYSYKFGKSSWNKALATRTIFSKFAQILIQVWRVELKRCICYSHSIHKMCLNTHASLASLMLFFNFEALWQVWQMLK